MNDGNAFETSDILVSGVSKGKKECATKNLMTKVVDVGKANSYDKAKYDKCSLTSRCLPKVLGILRVAARFTALCAPRY
jgi:hypothetical protein